MTSVFTRGKEFLSVKNYNNLCAPEPQNICSPVCPHEHQYVLRMCIRHSGGHVIVPPQLLWLKSSINQMIELQEQNDLFHPFVYVTVRHGEVTSTTDDEWHVDGFSMRKEHVPEQNYIFTDVFPTEYVDQSFPVPEDFDPMQHNLHWFLQDQVKTKNIKELPSKQWCLIDPYVVHRRPKVCSGTQRTFIRVSFVPIEIESDLNTPNPLLLCRRYEGSDIRNRLIRYA